MKQEYFVVVLAHSLRGRLRRVQIPHTAVYAVLGLAVLGGFSAFGFVASYARMVWKVANYNALKQEADSMRARYQNLQKVVSETNVQMASLQLYAREVSVAYGIKQKLEGPSDISSEGKMVPSFAESLQEYNYLINADKLAIANHRSRRFGAPTTTPSLWPVEGRLMDGFARRMDPFSGEGSFHKGVDITALIRLAAGLEFGLGLFRGDGFILKMNRQTAVLAQFIRKSLNCPCLVGVLSIQAARQANYQGLGVFGFDDTPESRQKAVIILQCSQRPRQAGRQ